MGKIGRIAKRLMRASGPDVGLTENLVEKLDSAAFELETAANQLRYSAKDVQKGVQLSPRMYEYVIKTSLVALNAVLRQSVVEELQRKIDEYQDTFTESSGSKTGLEMTRDDSATYGVPWDPIPGRPERGRP